MRRRQLRRPELVGSPSRTRLPVLPRRSSQLWSQRATQPTSGPAITQFPVHFFEIVLVGDVEGIEDVWLHLGSYTDARISHRNQQPSTESASISRVRSSSRASSSGLMRHLSLFAQTSPAATSLWQSAAAPAPALHPGIAGHHQSIGGVQPTSHGGAAPRPLAADDARPR